MQVTEKVEEDERRKAQLRESQVALSKKLEELRIQSRSTAREGLMLRHQVSQDYTHSWMGKILVDCMKPTPQNRETPD